MRKQVVAVVCDVACYDLNSIPVETAKLVAERLRDKSVINSISLHILSDDVDVFSYCFSFGCAVTCEEIYT